jgi:hypothetical protein
VDQPEPGRETRGPEPTVPAPGPATPASEPSIAVGWRIAAGLLAVASLPAILVTWFVGVITFTGCFIKCDETTADPLGGMLLYWLAGAFLVGGAVCAKLAVTGRTAGTARVAIVSAAVAGVTVVLSTVM